VRGSLKRGRDRCAERGGNGVMEAGEKMTLQWVASLGEGDDITGNDVTGRKRRRMCGGQK